MQNRTLATCNFMELPKQGLKIPLDQLYDKYAEVMVGVIANLTDDTEIADEILTQAFLEIKEKKVFEKPSYAVMVRLLKHTYNCAVSIIKKHTQVSDDDSSFLESKFMYLFLTQCSTLRQVALLLNMTEEMVEYKFRLEFAGIDNKTFVA